MPTTTTGIATEFITFSRTSNATVTDSDGLVKWAPHNLLLNSESFDTSSWTKTTTTVAANIIAAPNSTTTADTLTAAGANSTTLQSYTALAVPYTFGVWLRRKTGTGNIQIAADSGTYTTVTITSSWALYTVSQTPAAGTISAGIRIVTSADEVYAWGAHLYRSDLSMQNNTSAYPTYSPTTPKNLLGYSESFDNAAWSKTGTTTITANQAISPNNLLTGDLVNEGTGTGYHHFVQSVTTVASTTYTLSFYAKYITCRWISLSLYSNGNTTSYGAATFDLLNSVVGTSAASGTGYAIVGSPAMTSVGNGWYRCSLTVTNGSSLAAGFFAISPSDVGTIGSYGLNSYTGTSQTFYVWGAQLSNSASLDPYFPSYSTAPTAVAYYGPRRDFDGSTLACKGLLVEEQRANLALWSNRLDLSHSLAVTGVTGTFQNGETVTATGGGSGIYVSALSSSSTFILTAGSGTFTGTLTGGTSAAIATISSATAIWTPSNVTTAATATGPDGIANSATTLTASAVNGTVLQAITSTSAARITSMYVKRRTGSGIIDMTQDNGTTWTTVTVTSSWARVSIASTTAANPTVGIRIRTSGDAIDVFGMQHELGAFITSVIPTTAASATRNADVASVSTQAFPYSSVAGTMVVNASLAGGSSAAAAGDYYISLSDGTTSNSIHTVDVNSTISQIVASGSATFNQSIGSRPANGVIIKTGLAYESNNSNSAVNGTIGTTDTTVTLPPAATKLGIGIRADNFFPINGYIRQITYLPRRLTNAELQTRTA